MDAAGSKQATIYGWSEGGQMCLMFAATYPERTSALVLYGTSASNRNVSWPTAPPELIEQFFAAVETHWGEGILLPLNAPSRQKDLSMIQLIGRLERALSQPQLYHRSAAR